MDLPLSHSAAVQHPTEQGTDVPLSLLLKSLRRHLWLMSLLACVGAAAAFAFARTLPKTYTATGAIAVEGDRFAIPQLQGALSSESAPDPMPWVRTEAQALASPALVDATLRKLDLQNDEEFNPDLRPPTLLGRGKALIAELLPRGAATVQASADQLVLDEVEQALSVFQDNRSLVISTGFTARDPALAARFVNMLMSDYIAARAERRANVNRDASAAIGARVAEAKAGLDDIEQKMRDLRSTSEIVNLRAGSVGQQQAEELATAVARASVERAQLEASWNRATAFGSAGTPDALAGVLDSPTISRLREQESVSASKVAQLAAHYGSAYPGVQAAKADLSAVRSQVANEVARIVAGLGAQLRVARDKEADLRQQLAAAQRAGVVAENRRAELTELEQEAASRRALYQTLLEGAQRTGEQPTASQTPDVRILTAAVPPSMPSGPKTKLITGGGGAVGLLLGCLIAVLRLRSVETFDTHEDLGRVVGTPVLLSLPADVVRKGAADAVLSRPNGAEAEALRLLRARLHFAGRGGVPQSVLFSSAANDQAAPRLAASFARAVAASGERVLLVEGNLDGPAVAKLLKLSSDGLLCMLAHGADWRDCAVADPRSALDAIVSNHPVPGDAQALLGGVAMQNMLIEAEGDYDLVVLDAPAADSATAAVLCRRVDVTLLVLHGRAGRVAARKAAEGLRCAGSSPLHAVVIE